MGLHRTPTDIVPYLASDGITAFKLGNLAMITAQSATLSNFMSGDLLLGRDVGVALRPRKTADAPSGVHLGTWFYAISPNTPNPEIAWELLKWLTVRKESAGYFMLRQGRPSPVIDFNRNPEYYKLNPYWATVQEAMATAAYVPMIPPFANARKAWDDLFRRIVIDGESAEKELESIIPALQYELDTYWAQVN